MYLCENCPFDCRYCPLGNPCIDCADYDLENDTCTSNGACGDPDKKLKEQRNETN